MVGGIESLCFAVAVFGRLERVECMGVEQLHAVVEPAEFSNGGCQFGVRCRFGFQGADAPLEACDL